MTWGKCFGCLTITNTWPLEWIDKNGERVVSTHFHCRPCRASTRRALAKDYGCTNITVHKMR